MAYMRYAPDVPPPYLFPPYYALPPQNPYVYAQPLTPVSPYVPPVEYQRMRKRERHRSLPNISNAEYFFPQNYGKGTTPSTVPQQARRVLWMSDFLRSPKSIKYPALHPVLASDTTLVNFDVRVAPRRAIDPRAYTRFRDEPAMNPPTRHMRLISYDFPWVFEIDTLAVRSEGHPGYYVTCGDVWEALCVGLAAALKDTEWTLLAMSKGKDQNDRKRTIERIVEARGYEEGKFARRSDWLGRNVMFRGLAKNDDYAREVHLPGRMPCLDIWVVKFATPGTH
ncbi:hypothetical protein M0805_009430 [Coniferiporia weirii]|nr:hypothetical protein M0805_009430 [Coniferiporia weirii]